MKKNLIIQKDLSINKGKIHNRQVEKYFALERHPRQKKQDTSYSTFAPSVVAMLF